MEKSYELGHVGYMTDKQVIQMGTWSVPEKFTFVVVPFSFARSFIVL